MTGVGGRDEGEEAETGSLHLRLLIRETTLKVDSSGDERKRM